jgi:hypothetical protein
MDDTLTRFLNDLVGRLTGPMTFHAKRSHS